MSRTEIVHDDAVLRLGVCRNLVLPAWFDAPEAVHIRAMGRVILGAWNRNRGDFAVLNTLVSGTPRFHDDVRSELVKIMREPRAQGRGAAHVIAIDGLAGVASRAFLSTVFLVGRSTSPNKVFDEARAASAWLAPILSSGREPWTIDDMVAAQRDVARAPVASAV